jgi:tetratricopeptide (TPR) repeat protein
VRLAFRKSALPLVEDTSFLSRVDVLSQQMRVRTPVVRLLKSLTGEQQALAFAGGIVAPSLVVTDGILHRLQADERDAVVAHELAHLANHSIWWLVCVTPLALTAAVLSDPFLPAFTTLALGAALRSGLFRIVSRHFERDCDRRAGRVLGFGNMASALRKIHAVHPLRDRGWLSVLIYATTTHPSREERLAALWRAAPDDDRPEVDWSDAEERRRRLAAHLATLAWAAAITAMAIQGVLRRDTSWPTALLVAWVVGVPVVYFAGNLRRLRRERRRTSMGRRRWPLLLGIALTALMLGFAYIKSGAVDQEPLGAVPVVALVVVAVIGLLAALGFITVESTPAHVPKLRNELLAALHDGDFAQAAAIGADNAERMRKYPDFRHNAALACALGGDYARGVAELRQTTHDHPQFVQALLTQSALLADDGNCAESLALAEQAGCRLKGDPEPLLKAAWALWRLGRHEEAELATNRVCEIEPDQGISHVILAGIAVERGDEAAARAELVLAERLSPGTPAGKLVAAEAALRFGSTEEARAAIEQAEAAASAHPLALLTRQVAALRRRLQDSQPDTAGALVDATTVVHRDE